MQQLLGSPAELWDDHTVCGEEKNLTPLLRALVWAMMASTVEQNATYLRIARLLVDRGANPDAMTNRNTTYHLVLEIADNAWWDEDSCATASGSECLEIAAASVRHSR